MSKRRDPLALSLAAAPAPETRAYPRVAPLTGTAPRRPAGFDLSPDPRARILKQSRRRDSLVAPLAASALAHALIAAVLLLRLSPRLPEATPPATVALVWQPNPSRKLALPNPGTFKNAPPAEARRGSRGRVAPVTPPRPATPPPPPPQQQAAAPTQAPEQKAPNAEQQQAAKQATPSPKREARRTPPAPRPSDNPFAHIVPNLALMGPPAPSLSAPGEHSAQMPGPAPPGHASMGSSVDSLDAPNASPDWEAEMRAWVEARDYYPEEAVVKHEEGISTVEITIDKTGKVTDLELVGMSGSDRLDDAWLSVFRNRTVPAPTPDMNADPSYTFRATLQYVLIETAPP